ncbi:hypothetical protein EYC84_000539 [Monilinia fructicola]|uniref:Uncharacterized protein n=1 Tax=Monilinia fructicola TaxID=38448 RepID=A0A5M9JS15_MONFR|nr:hypothetical protein EYC84_000539 [Monilinia fructicola]
MRYHLPSNHKYTGKARKRSRERSKARSITDQEINKSTTITTTTTTTTITTTTTTTTTTIYPFSHRLRVLHQKEHIPLVNSTPRRKEGFEPSHPSIHAPLDAI